MSSNIKRTIQAAYLTARKGINEPWAPAANTTINQTFQVHENLLPLAGEYAKIGYVMIGNKGAKAIPQTDGFVDIQPLEHSARDTGLFGPMPWVVRKIHDDLKAEERSRYRMRHTFTKDGVTYVAYYMRAIDTSNTESVIEERRTENGEVETSIFVPSAADLTPVPTDASNINVNNFKGSSLIVTTKLRLDMDRSDIAELINAATIVFGSPRYAIISEAAICHAIDRTVSGMFGTAQGTYTEAVCAQVTAFSQHFMMFNEGTSEWGMSFDVGSSELM